MYRLAGTVLKRMLLPLHLRESGVVVVESLTGLRNVLEVVCKRIFLTFAFYSLDVQGMPPRHMERNGRHVLSARRSWA